MAKEVQTVEELVDLLRQRRKDLGVTQTDLADFSGLHRKAIGKIESHNADPRLSSILRMSELLGLKILVSTNEDT